MKKFSFSPTGLLISGSILLLLVLFINYSILPYTFDNPVYQAKRRIYSLSQGERYFGYLSLWHLAVRANDWQTASQLEKHLDPVDLEATKKSYNPEYLKKQINVLVVKKNKTVEDWIELAKLYQKIGNTDEVKNALKKAYQLDPIRSDIEQLYLQFQKLK